MLKIWVMIQALFGKLESQKDEGQSLVEYGLIIALIAVAVIVVLGLLGGKLTSLFTNITNSL